MGEIVPFRKLEGTLGKKPSQRVQTLDLRSFMGGGLVLKGIAVEEFSLQAHLGLMDAYLKELKEEVPPKELARWRRSLRSASTEELHRQVRNSNTRDWEKSPALYLALIEKVRK